MQPMVAWLHTVKSVLILRCMLPRNFESEQVQNFTNPRAHAPAPTVPRILSWTWGSGKRRSKIVLLASERRPVKLLVLTSTSGFSAWMHRRIVKDLQTCIKSIMMNHIIFIFNLIFNTVASRRKKYIDVKPKVSIGNFYYRNKSLGYCRCEALLQSHWASERWNFNRWVLSHAELEDHIRLRPRGHEVPRFNIPKIHIKPARHKMSHIYPGLATLLRRGHDGQLVLRLQAVASDLHL